MRRLPAPLLPPPGPPNPPNAPPTPSDSPKLGDARVPTGVARFTWFKMFWKLIETFTLYRFSLAGPPPPPCGPGPAPVGLAPPPPPAAAAATAGVPPGPPGPPAGRAAAALPRWMLPKANARLTRRLTTNAPGA